MRDAPRSLDVDTGRQSTGSWGTLRAVAAEMGSAGANPQMKFARARPRECPAAEGFSFLSPAITGIIRPKASP